MVVVYFLRGLANTVLWLGAFAIGFGVLAGLIHTLWRLLVKPADDPESRQPRVMTKRPS